jgi:hypothetical protein
METYTFEELTRPPAPKPASKPVVVQAVPMPLPVASAPAPNPNAALVAAMQTRNATAAAAPAAPAAPAMPAIPPPPKQQAGEAPVNYKRRLSEYYQRIDQMKIDAVKEAEKTAREAAAPKVSPDPAAFSAKEQKLKDFEGYLKDYKDELAKNLTVFPTKIPLIPSQGIEIPLPVGSDTARMQAKYNALLMGVKDAYQLGALTGPDMGIVEAQITNPASISGMMHSKEAFGEQVKVLDGILERAKNNLETSYGRKMSYTVPVKPGAQGAQPSAQETAPPPSLLKEGHITTFANGQQWSMRNGKVERVK